MKQKSLPVPEINVGWIDLGDKIRYDIILINDANHKYDWIQNQDLLDNTLASWDLPKGSGYFNDSIKSDLELSHCNIFDPRCALSIFIDKDNDGYSHWHVWDWLLMVKPLIGCERQEQWLLYTPVWTIYGTVCQIYGFKSYKAMMGVTSNLVRRELVYNGTQIMQYGPTHLGLKVWSKDGWRDDIMKHILEQDFKEQSEIHFSYWNGGGKYRICLYCDTPYMRLRHIELFIKRSIKINKFTWHTDSIGIYDVELL